MSFDPSTATVACPFCHLPGRVVGSSAMSYVCDNGHQYGVNVNGALFTQSVFVMAPSTGEFFPVAVTPAPADREKIFG